MNELSRTFFLVFSGLFGAGGVAGAAVAAHGGDDRLVAIAAAIAFVHAPALLGIAALPDAAMRLKMPSGLLMIVGVALFSGDLAARTFLGDRLFANAAPFGGMILIGAWLLVAVGAVAARVSPPKPPRNPLDEGASR